MAVFELIKIFKKERSDIVCLNSSEAGIIGAFTALFQNKIIYMSGYDYNLAPKYDICEQEKLVKFITELIRI